MSNIYNWVKDTDLVFWTALSAFLSDQASRGSRRCANYVQHCSNDYTNGSAGNCTWLNIWLGNWKATFLTWTHVATVWFKFHCTFWTLETNSMWKNSCDRLYVLYCCLVCVIMPERHVYLCAINMAALVFTCSSLSMLFFVQRFHAALQVLRS